MKRALFAVVLLFMAGAVHGQGLTVTTDGFEEGVNQSINQGEAVRRQREAEARARAEANRPIGPVPEPCRVSSDTCFDIVKIKDGEIEIVCRKGLDYKVGQTRKICGRGDNWHGCAISDAFAAGNEIRVAGNKACD